MTGSLLIDIDDAEPSMASRRLRDTPLLLDCLCTTKLRRR